MSSSKDKKKRPHGQIRQSQVVMTFGPGSMFDLPNQAVIVGGLEYWTKGDEIHEPRLLAKLKDLLQLPSLVLHAPPPADDDPGSTQKTGIDSIQFPEWFMTQSSQGQESRSQTRSRRLVHRTSLSGVSKFIDEEKKSQPVVPIRFVRACKKGHIGDIDWYAFAHGGATSCRRPLWIDERGTSGDLSEVWVRCECGQAERPIIDAIKLPTNPLGHCDGSRPWLGPFMKEPCGDLNRLLIRTASNAYFPQTMSVISLPDKNETVAEAVDQVWEHHLQYVEDLDDLIKERKRKPPVKAALEGLADEEVFAEIQSAKRGPVHGLREVGQAGRVRDAGHEQGRDRLGSTRWRLLRSLPSDNQWKAPWTQAMERVVLVHRLREVIAQVGFTRFEAFSPDSEGELEIGVTRAPLAREISWLPAVENRGEGIFVQFRREAIDSWLHRPEVKRRGRQLEAGFECWKKDHKSDREFIGLPFVLLHSLSHLLITAVSLECGYPASSIRERIYAGSYGYGILLYTGTPDAEGTMGGLVEAGRQIARHLKNAIDLGRLCSNDPVCAQHAPENQHECRFLHGAACHGCLLIAETSCEQHNDFLDRALLVSTVDGNGAEFFDGSTVMLSSLHRLSTEDLRQLADALRSGWVALAVLLVHASQFRP